MRLASFALIVVMVVTSLPLHAATPQRTRPVSDFRAGQQVRLVGPGEEVPRGLIIVTSRPLGSGPRIFVGPHGSDVVLLNLTAPGLSGSLVRRLRRLAVEQTSALREPGTLVLDDLQLGPDGLIVDGRKVADLSQVVDRIATADIVGGGVLKNRRLDGGMPVAAIVVGAVAGVLVAVLAVMAKNEGFSVR